MTHKPSTRSLSRLSGSYVRSTPGSQSLERGLALLRAFRLGTSVLTNTELAARTGLPRPTVSRLSRSLVESGFLEYDFQQQGYRLGVVCMSLGLSCRSAQAALDAALPLMRTLAEGRRINVGLAICDQTEMVYLDSVRLSRAGAFRRLVPGSRVPVALTSLGRAHLSLLPSSERRVLYGHLAEEYRSHWKPILAEINAALRSIKERGFCWAYWQEGIIAIATPIQAPGGRRYALNVSLPVDKELGLDAIEYHGLLAMELAASVKASWGALQPPSRS